ncbi:hypothetical protein V8G54_027419 [Vigna mungo]|uniref:DOG1 domain-containing protein n=1 Tax=Vigna mungo TaxID=3915 RepID=A0AAQ3N0Q6_VIGMU
MVTSFANFHRFWFVQLKVMVKDLKDDHTVEAMERVMRQHQEYFVEKWEEVERDPLSVFLAPWTTTLERSLHWITGWRPTTIFHLIYTESALLFETHIIDILYGIRTGDLGDLSSSQFRLMSELQCETVKEENEITEELAEWQESASEMMSREMDMSEKIRELIPIIKKADDLRMKTLKGVVRLLSKQQAMEFLIASGELLFGIRSWGMTHDASTS